MHRLVFLWFPPVLLLITGCTPQKKSHTAELDSWFAAQFPAEEPGGAVLIMKEDEILFSKGYGIADLETGEPVTTKTLFNLGSISKTFVANAILILAEQRKLSLEDSLSMYFPEFKNKRIADNVKIKHLLNHTSGLPDNRNVGRDTVFYLTATDRENWYPVTQTDELRFEPGSQFEYSNPAYNGLALIIEKVSGIKWQQFVKDNILTPAGMPTSTITDGPHPESGVAHAYYQNAKGQWIEDDYGEEPTFAAAGNGGVWSSVEELAQYERALRNNTFLSPETTSASRTIQRFGNWNGNVRPVSGWSWHEPNLGWSWFVNTDENGDAVIGHTGTQGGFVANYVSIPDKGILIVILCNAPRDIKSLTDTAVRWVK